MATASDLNGTDRLTLTWSRCLTDSVGKCLEIVTRRT
jgi:hypothetical protein